MSPSKHSFSFNTFKIVNSFYQFQMRMSKITIITVNKWAQNYLEINDIYCPCSTGEYREMLSRPWLVYNNWARLKNILECQENNHNSLLLISLGLGTLTGAKPIIIFVQFYNESIKIVIERKISSSWVRNCYFWHELFRKLVTHNVITNFVRAKSPRTVCYRLITFHANILVK